MTRSRALAVAALPIAFLIGAGDEQVHGRTNGVVSNMPEFLKAFACPANARMVQQPVCRVW